MGDKYRDLHQRVCREHPVYNVICPTNPNPQEIGNFVEVEIERLRARWGLRAQKKQGLLDTVGLIYTDMNF